ncbi:MAG: STAS domain-containing protein [Firmicutes bacterium]|nr:STAS domain-containing protein [Bacillota bacterium]
MALEIKKTFDKENDRWVIKPNGEIDIYTSPEFKETLLDLIEESETDIVINGENLDYIDSTGLGVLISGLKKLKEKERNIIIINIKKNINKLLDITGLNKVFIVKECK